jgi:hypothetical protein
MLVAGILKNVPIIKDCSMDRFLYRGVSRQMYDQNIGIKPKGNSIESYVEMGSSIAEMGNGISLGCSNENAIISHQKDSNEYKTSGLSTTPHLDRAEFYATHDGKQNGIIYKIDTNKLLEFQVRMFVVDDLVIGPEVPANDEVVLVHKDNGILPIEIITEIIEVSTNDYNNKNNR